MVTVALSANVVESEGEKELKNVPCQICRKKGHGALNCYNQFTNKFPPTNPRVVKPGQMTANLAWSSNVQWYPDTRATNHVTPELGNIQHPISKGGMIYATNGEPMGISHHGKSSFAIGSRKFLLDDLLTVPTATKNLMFVRQFSVRFVFDDQCVNLMD